MPWITSPKTVYCPFQSGIGAQADEELAGRAVRIVALARRADRAAHERARAEFGGHIRLIRLSGAPPIAIYAAARLRIAALNNEIGQDAVKAEPVIEISRGPAS